MWQGGSTSALIECLRFHSLRFKPFTDRLLNLRIIGTLVGNKRPFDLSVAGFCHGPIGRVPEVAGLFNVQIASL